MKKPNSLSVWTMEYIRELVESRTDESDWFDFKVSLPDKKSGNYNKHCNSIRECACSMANTQGGYIIFGVKDGKENCDRICGIDLNIDLSILFDDIIKIIDPNIRLFDFHRIPFSDDPKRGIWIVYIHHSQYRPHMVNHKFYKRTSGGKSDPMNANEVREMIENIQNRTERLYLLKIHLLDLSRIISTITVKINQPHLIPFRFETETFRIIISDITSSLPYDITILLLEVCNLFSILNKELDWVREEYLFRALNGGFNIHMHTEVMTDTINILNPKLILITKRLIDIYPDIFNTENMND